MERYFEIKLIEEYIGLIVLGIFIAFYIFYAILLIYDKISYAWMKRKKRK